MEIKNVGIIGLLINKAVSYVQNRNIRAVKV